MTKRISLLVVALTVVSATFVFAGGGGEAGSMERKTITIDLMSAGPSINPPVEDVVTPIMEKDTGVRANPIPHPTGFTDWGPAVQAMIAGNNLPDVITQHYITPNVDAIKILHERNMLWDFDEATLKEYMPNFIEKMTRWGDLEVWMDNEETVGGTHYRLTNNISVNALPKLRDQYKGTEFYRKNTIIGWPYVLAIRDDILKKIFPNARSDAEQEKWYVENFDPENPTDAYADIPIHSMDDLYQFLKKVKQIIDSQNLMVGSDKMIPAQLNADAGSSSIMWSFITTYGYWWTEPPFRVADRVYYNFSAPWVKPVVQWWNKLYNEGLLDPELFVKPTAQFKEEITRGRFAVFNDWGYADPARKYAKENNLGFGYRQLACWWPITYKNTYNDASNQWVTYFNHFGATLVTKAVKEQDFPQVAGWVDYHYSDAFDVLTSWGPPEFYTGTGENRRFRSEYKDVENYQVYGITGGKDGRYYNVSFNSPAPGIAENEIVWATYMGHFTAYPEAPQYVYPKVRQYGENYDQTIRTAYTAYYQAQLVNFFPQKGWTNAELNAIPTFAPIQYMWFGGAADGLAKAIVGKTQDFEANYANYMKFFADNNYDQGMADYQAKWKEIFDKYIKQYWR